MHHNMQLLSPEPKTNLSPINGLINTEALTCNTRDIYMFILCTTQNSEEICNKNRYSFALR